MENSICCGFKEKNIGNIKAMEGQDAPSSIGHYRPS